MPYHYLAEVATADIAFETWGKTKEEMFTAAADALTNVMVEDLGTISQRLWREVTVEDENVEMLLFHFLQEFIYYKDAEQLLLRAGPLRFREKNGKMMLIARMYGEKLDPSKHHFNADVKAVTMHQFRVRENNGEWEARVVLDI